MKMAHKGFTLIELVITIALLSILAAVALPRFIDTQSDSRRSVMQGVEASLRSALPIIKSKAKLEGDTGAGTVSVELGTGGNTTVDTTDALIPAATAGGIGSAIDLSGDVGTAYTTGAGTEIATFSFNSTSNCEVVYTVTTATGAAAITTDFSGC